jgi:hypothetical protein
MMDAEEMMSSVVEHSRKLRKLIDDSGNSEVKRISSELIVELEKIHENVSLLIRENLDQKNEIKQLKARLAGKPDYQIKNNVYYTPDGDGPFCPFCSANRGKRIRLRTEASPDSSSVNHACRVCGGVFSDNAES